MTETSVDEAILELLSHPAKTDVFIEQINTVPIEEFDRLAERCIHLYIQIIPMLFPALTKIRKDPNTSAQKMLLFWEKYTEELDNTVRKSQPYLLETVTDMIHMLESAAASARKESMQRAIMDAAFVFSLQCGRDMLQASTDHERTHIRIALRHISQRLRSEPEDQYVQNMINQLDEITN